MILAKRKSIAAIALAAIAFAAVSPAIAAALFSGRAEILGRMLGIPVASQATAVPQDPGLRHDGSPHESGDHAAHGEAHSGHHASSNHDSQGDSQHAAHGIFCSFCLTPSSTVTLLEAAAGTWEVTRPIDTFIPAEREQRAAGVLPSTHHPRDPPVILN